MQQQIRTRNDFLQNELRQWVKSDYRPEFSKLWAKVVARVKGSAPVKVIATSATARTSAPPPAKASHVASISSQNKKRQSAVVVVDATAKKKAKR